MKLRNAIATITLPIVLFGCSVQIAPKAEEPVQWREFSIINPFCISDAKELVRLERTGVANLTPKTTEEAQQLNRYIRLSERMFFEEDCRTKSSQIRSGNAQDLKGTGKFFRGLSAENSKDSPVPKEDVVAFRLYVEVVAYKSKEGAKAFVGSAKWNEFLERRRRAAAFNSA